MRNVPIYIFIGLVIRYYFLQFGAHPTVAGVLIAFSIPMYCKTNFHALRSKNGYTR
ncbi:MAG: hypothetical protein GVY19_09220 [Bacteroidetes bacterium]|nr:hypothetical protein [Bacteroidota bacterium]